MKPLRRVLVVHPYGIGDLLFATPVLRALRLVPTVEKVDLLLGSRSDSAVRSNPHVDEIFVIDKDRLRREGRIRAFRELAALAWRLRDNHYDALLDYSQRDEYGFLAQFLWGIGLRAGFGYKRRGRFYTRRFPVPEGFSARHAVDYYCDLAEFAGIPVDDRFLEFYLTPEEREFAGRLLEQRLGEKWPRFIAVSPGGGDSWGRDAGFKRWPAGFFAQLIGRLSEILGIRHAVIFGSPGEKALGLELEKRLEKIACVNLTGEISLPQAAAVISRASLFTGNDGGLVHIAHALRVPLIAFYGPVDPAVYGPYPASARAAAVFKEGLDCRPCYKKFRYNQACEKRECLRELTPDEVMAVLEKKNFISGLARV